jgi:signal transduction histidine kinase
MSGATPVQEQLLSNLIRESDKLGRLVGGLLSMARLDQGGAFSKEAVHLNDLCRDELDVLRGRIDGRIELRFDCDPSLEAILLNEEATREALANLLDNARRHAVARIALSCRVGPAGLEIAVADDGPGLPHGTDELAFERFVSLDGVGSGLGLAIARGLCEAQGGTLTHEAGRFVMRLPV